MDLKMDITGVKLETKRLLLRPWEQNDLEDFYDYARVEGVGELAGWPHHQSIDVSRRILQSFIQGKATFALVYQETGKVIGSLGLQRSPYDGDPSYQHLRMKEIGYALSKAYWGSGFMPEAVRAVLEFLFSRCGADAVTAFHFAENGQSKRVLEKCGFRFVKQSEQYNEQLQKQMVHMEYILYKDWWQPAL